MTDLARRNFVIAGLAGLPLSTVLAHPGLAAAAAAGLEAVTLETADGRMVSAALALPEVTPAPAVLLVHEWWGLNDQIKAVAAELAREGYVALAVDLYDGKVAEDRDSAKAYMQGVVEEEAKTTLADWIAWLRRHETVKGGLGTVGWCFGGGWSLNASAGSPVEATVVYYGRVNQPSQALANLRGPVLGHFASQDQWINREMVGGFEANMSALGKPFESHWYEAQHAFANPSGGRYDQADAKLAWERTLAFFKANL